MSKLINLNADMGESFGAYIIGNDPAMLDVVGAANVACGYHAGDPLVMGTTVELAKQNNVSIGAHPGFPDLQGFGRRKMVVAHPELEAMIIYQVGALQAIANTKGASLTHVKPHGTLNTMACVDMEMSRAIARAVKAIADDMILLAPAGSCLFKAGLEAGLPTASEVFADRTYDAHGNLTPRGEPGAVIHDPEQSADQILSFLEAGKILTPNGDGIEAPIHSICVHGDSANALAIAHRVKDRLADAGYQLADLPSVMAAG
ncbi:LamB/YcsF family protein [Terasakiella pusilla]|uniref:LamB/YcsF family protein n=1 Tax=Terasakiella pusilla TaxID=64973 RepID=UPI003AA891A9